MKSVIIIGRPNVGKSTLFNRLTGKRRSITDSLPGVTRDLITEVWNLSGHFVNLTDSGGISLERDKDDFNEMVADKSFSLLKTADAIIFLVDCMQVTTEDEALIEKLRSYSDKTILTVNKIDDVSREAYLWNFFSYGYQRVLGISSSHGNGIDDLEKNVLEILNFQNESNEIQEEKADVKIAILGKPNTGKSTLANLLSGNEISMVSPVAGTTRDVVKGSFEYKGKKFSILDTAGIRRKSKVIENVEYYSVNRAIKTIDEADVVLLVIDSVEGLSEQDKKISSLVEKQGKGIVLVMNKKDLLRGVSNELRALEDRVRFLFPVLSFAPLCFISSKSGDGIKEMLDVVLKVNSQLERRIDTAVLNNALSSFLSSYQIPRSNKDYYKIYYGTQVCVKPVKFLLFVNKKKNFPVLYIQYLKNRIRKDLDFSMIAIQIELRERNRSQSNYNLGQNTKNKSKIKYKRKNK